MAPNKFEKHIKKQLQEREIRPSVDAWNRIQDRLDTVEKPKTKTILWYGIAAGFIGIMFVSVLFFNLREVTTEPRSPIVSGPSDPTGKKESKAVVKKEAEGSQLVIEEKETIETVTVGNHDSIKSEPTIAAENGILTLKKVEVTTKISKELINGKIAEIVAKVDLLEDENTVVTDMEIDSLLSQAQREIIADKIFRKDNSVDVDALLADVEDELDKSFRDQIFDALKEGFVKVRTAVADRNK